MNTVRSLLAALTLVGASARVQAGPNLYPDPGFESTGETGTAHSGAKAGHLTVGAPSHWAAIGASITVEPFARYRVTEWVKATVGKGIFFAPHCYGWDEYEWAFSAARPVPTMADWGQTEVTFVTPNTTMSVNPLAAIDAEACEAWVDDVVVEKIAEPEQVMAELSAKAEPTPAERQLLARWYVKQGRMADAQAQMRAADGLARADIATVLARNTPDRAARRPFVVEVVAYGGPTFASGLVRFAEITAGWSVSEKFAVAVEGVLRNPGLDRAGRAARLVIEDLMGAASNGTETLADASADARGRQDGLREAMAALPPDAAAAPELRAAMASVDKAVAALAAQRAALGTCVVQIGGVALTPETHAIILPNQPTAPEEYAARDLRRHLEWVTGRALPIRLEKDAGECTPLHVGRCEQTRSAGIDVASLGVEGIHVKTSGPALYLAGNQRGVGYAVSVFLEDYVGCRWFTPDCATWPQSGTIVVPEVDRRYLPPLEYRGGDFPIARQGEFANHLRLNGANHALSDEQGGKVGVRSLAHTFAALVPPDTYYKDHPEYFSLVNGKRQSGYAQLCLTHPEVLRLAIAGVRQWIKDDPRGTVFSVSQNDTANYCECAACTAVADAEGSQSGPVLRFVNAVADDIGKDYPNVAIETLAYQYTRKPPKLTKPRPNVIICLCSIECCFIHPLGSDPFNQTFADDIRGWNKICDRLWIWDYIINYAHSICPFPNLYVLQPNIDFFIASGVKGIYEESCYYTPGSELQELRNYVMAKLLWDPRYDVDTAIDEFCAAFYGPAAQPLRAYINLIHQSTQQDPKLHVQIYTHPRAYVTPAVIAQAGALFDQAEAAVKGDAIRLHRVQVARLPILYAEITLSSGGTLAERGDQLVQQGGTDVTALAARFESIARAAGVTMVNEGTAFDSWLQGVPRPRRQIAIERLRNPALDVAVLPELGGRIWRLKLVPSGRELLKVEGSEGAWIPTTGGYEEYSQDGYRSPGWNEAYSVQERTERTLTMAVDLRNGLRLTRRLELDPLKPLLTIRSTLTNIGAEVRTARLRAHPEFAVTSTEQASVRILSAAGTWQTVSLANPADPTAELNEWRRDGELPAGAWAVVDEAADVAIMDRFAPGQVVQALLNRSGAQSRVNLEIYSPEVQLPPGKSLSLEHAYEIITPAAGAFR
jgi:hypothetical protein